MVPHDCGLAVSSVIPDAEYYEIELDPVSDETSHILYGRAYPDGRMVMLKILTGHCKVWCPNGLLLLSDRSYSFPLLRYSTSNC